MYVNLLPPTFIRELALRRQAWRWGWAVALTLLICGGVVGVQYGGVVSARRSQAASAFRSRELHAVKADTKRFVVEGKTIEAAIADLKKARMEDRTLALLGIASTCAKKIGAEKSSGKVHLRSLTTQMASLAAAPVLPGPPGKKPASSGAILQAENDLVFEGNADDAAAIASFIESLRETGVFTRVDLTATSEASGSNAAERQFRVDCKF